MIPAAISNFLERNHAKYSLLTHPTAVTAQEEAAAAHIPGNKWAKTIVCYADGQPILAVVPAPYAVDLPRLREAVHARDVRLGKENEFGPLFEDCELGAMPPLGPLFGQRVFIDKRLAAGSEVAFAGGSHHDAIRMSYSEFDRIVHPTVAEFAGRLSPISHTTYVIDPVCGASLREDTVTWRSWHHGDTYYYFCSQRCKMEFDDNPLAYTRGH
jgi:Ala-tRNA(Pro) deacylase